MSAENPMVATGKKIGSEIVFEWLLAKGMGKLGQVVMDGMKPPKFRGTVYELGQLGLQSVDG